MANQTNSRVEVPIYQRILSNGDVRYWVPVSIGDGKPIEAMLDTGSFGFRVLESAVSPAQYQATDMVRHFSFGSGVVYTGELARATVKIGRASTGGPVLIQVIRSVECRAMRPNCPASRVDPSEYRIGGDGLPGEGFPAILGLSMRVPDVANAALNPLLSFGNQRWIVALPLPGQSAPGQLVINPSEAELAGFRQLQLPSQSAWNGMADGGPGFSDSAVPLCADGTTDPASCPPVKLDSGARNGLEPFYSFVVMYDAKHGVMGFKSRN